MTGPQPQNVPLAIDGDADGDVDRPVGDLAVTDLDHDRVDEDRRVDLIQRAHCPVVHFLEHPVGDPRHGLFGDRRPIDCAKCARSPRWSNPSRRATTRSHPPRTGGVAVCARSAVRTTRPIRWHIDLDMPGRLGQLRLGTGPVAHVPDPAARVWRDRECSVNSSSNAVCSTVLVSCFNRPSGPVSDKPCSLAWRTSSRAPSAPPTQAATPSSWSHLPVLRLRSSHRSFPPAITASESDRKHR